MLHGVIQDDAVVVVDDLGLVPELDRPRPSAVGRNAKAGGHYPWLRCHREQDKLATFGSP
nr:hypothetical protein [Mycobacterium canetti]